MPSYRRTRAGDGLRETRRREEDGTARLFGLGSVEEMNARYGVGMARNFVEIFFPVRAVLRSPLLERSSLLRGLPGSHDHRLADGEEGE